MKNQQQNEALITQRLSKMMAAAGVASRRRCEEIIFEGRVTVNGKAVLLPQTMVSPSDTLIVDGRPLSSIEKKVYYLLNKPLGYLCSNSSSRREKLVVDLFAGSPHRLFTVGRLDKETSGLLIVTNDGHFAQRVIHPSADIEKEYLAEANLPLSPHHLQLIRKGTHVEGTFVQPKRVDKVGTRSVRVVIKEGKKREVRLLLQQAGLSVVRLCRTRIGQLSLENLPIGQWREMTENEITQIFSKG